MISWYEVNIDDGEHTCVFDDLAAAIQYARRRDQADSVEITRCVAEPVEGWRDDPEPTDAEMQRQNPFAL